MPQRRAAIVPLRAAVLALTGWIAVSALSCQSLQESLYGPQRTAPAGDSRAEATLVGVGGWEKDRLHCDAGRCERWYTVQLSDPGVLKVDLYAPTGARDPDCEMVLEDDAGEVLATRTGRVKSRRQLRYDADPGKYLLKVRSKGDNKGSLAYELNVRLGEKAAPAPRRVVKRKPAKPEKPEKLEKLETPEKPESTSTAGDPPEETPTEVVVVEDDPFDSPGGIPDVPIAPGYGDGEELEDGTSSNVAEPPPPPEPEPVYVEAEVLDLEEEEGEVRVVLIEAGEKQGLVLGMRGQLVDGGQEIGQIEIIQVLQSGSRARVLGSLTGSIGFDTLSRIEVPPDGE